MKLMQTLMFDSGGFKGRLCACPLLGTWHALLCGELFVGALDEATAVFGRWMTRSHYLPESEEDLKASDNGSYSACWL